MGTGSLYARSDLQMRQFWRTQSIKHTGYFILHHSVNFVSDLHPSDSLCACSVVQSTNAKWVHFLCRLRCEAPISDLGVSRSGDQVSRGLMKCPGLCFGSPAVWCLEVTSQVSRAQIISPGVLFSVRDSLSVLWVSNLVSDQVSRPVFSLRPALNLNRWHEVAWTLLQSHTHILHLITSIYWYLLYFFKYSSRIQTRSDGCDRSPGPDVCMPQHPTRIFHFE